MTIDTSARPARVARISALLAVARTRSPRRSDALPDLTLMAVWSHLSSADWTINDTGRPVGARSVRGGVGLGRCQVATLAASLSALRLT